MIPKEQYQEWRHHPVSKVVLQFLRDKQEYLKAAALDHWVNGSQSFASINEVVRGQIVELGEIADLQFEAIEAFYQEKEANATSSADTDSRDNI